MRGEEADCLLMGTLAQFERLLPKLQAQPFGLRRLGRSIEAALRNYDEPTPACHPGLDLSDAPLIMGVLNVTPDSFSDGGLLADTDAAVQCGAGDGRDGAALVDVGGESTRPGADPVPLDDERERVLPVVRALAAALPGPDLRRHLQGARWRPRRLPRGPTWSTTSRLCAWTRRWWRWCGTPTARWSSCTCSASPRPCSRRPSTPTWSGGVRVLRGAAQLGCGQRAEGGEPAHRPGHRLRQDHGAQSGDTSRIWRPSGLWAGRSWLGPRASDSWARSSASTEPQDRDEATAATTVMAVDGRRAYRAGASGSSQSRRGARRPGGLRPAVELAG